jgi:myb proto-oncogene protein
MIKKNQWSKEEEWILFICHRQYGNQWADIAHVLEGRTDNTIKNHWNSSMRKKLSDFKKEFEIQSRKHCQDLKLEYLGVSLEQMKSFPVAYRNAIK